MPDPNPYIIDTDSIIIRNGFFYLSNTYNPQSTNAMIAVGANGAITYTDTLRNISTYGVGYLPDVFSTFNAQLSNLSTTIYNGGIQEPDFSAACLSLSTTTNDLSNWTADQVSTLSIGISAVESLFYSTVYASSVTSVQLVSTGNSLQTQINTNSTATGNQISTTLAYMSTNPFGYAYSSAVNALSTYVYSTLTQGLSTTNENLNATASTQGIEISTLAGGFQTLSSLVGFSTLSSQIASTNQQLSSLSSYVADIALSTANNTILIQNLSTSLSTTNASISSLSNTITSGYATGNDISTISSALSSYATVANICTISSALSSYATLANICSISASLSGYPSGNDISTISSALSSYATVLALSNVSISQQQYVPLSGLSSLFTSSLTTNNIAVRNQFAVSSFFVNGNSNTLGGTNPAFDQNGALRVRTAQAQGIWLENTNNQPCEIALKNTSQTITYSLGSQTGTRGMFFYTGVGDAINADSNRNVAIALGSTNTAYKFFVNGNAYAPAFFASSILATVLTVGTLNASNITGSVTGDNLSTLSSALSSYATIANICTISSSLSSYATVANICTISSALSSYATVAQLSSLSGGIRTTYATGTSVSTLSASLSSYATVANICTISSALSSYATVANICTISAGLSNYITFNNLSSLATSSLTTNGLLVRNYALFSTSASTAITIRGSILSTIDAVDITGSMTIHNQDNPCITLTNDQVAASSIGVEICMCNATSVGRFGQGGPVRGTYINVANGDAITINSNKFVGIFGPYNTNFALYVSGNTFASTISAHEIYVSSIPGYATAANLSTLSSALSSYATVANICTISSALSSFATGNNISTISSALSSYATVANICTISSALSSFATGNDISTISSALSSYATVANICTISSALSSFATGNNISTISSALSSYATVANICTISSALSSYATVANICTISSALSNYVGFSNLSSLAVSSLTVGNNALMQRLSVSSTFVASQLSYVSSMFASGQTALSTLSASYVYVNNAALSTLMFISGNVNTIGGTNPILDVVGAMRVKNGTNQSFWLEAGTGAEFVYKLTGVAGVMANGYQSTSSRGYYIYTGSGDALNADASRNVAIAVGSTNTAYRFFVNGNSFTSTLNTGFTSTTGLLTSSIIITNGGTSGTPTVAPTQIAVVNNGNISAFGLAADNRGTFIYAAGGDVINIFSTNRQVNVKSGLCVESSGAYMGFRNAAASFRFVDFPTSNSFVRAKYTASGTTDTLVASTTAVLYDTINTPTVNAWMPGLFQLTSASGNTLNTFPAGSNIICAQNFTLTSNDWNHGIEPYYMAFRGGLNMTFSTSSTTAPIRWYATYQNFTQGSGERFMKGSEHFTIGNYVTTRMEAYSYSTGVDSEKARVGDNISIRYFAQDYTGAGIKIQSTPTEFSMFISPVRS